MADLAAKKPIPGNLPGPTFLQPGKLPIMRLFKRPTADSSDVDRGYRVKAISVPAIPIRVGAQRRWRDSVSREVIEIVKLGELSSERSEAILMWSWDGGVGEGAGV